jgi:hypothetical protein
MRSAGAEDAGGGAGEGEGGMGETYFSKENLAKSRRVHYPNRSLDNYYLRRPS